MILSELIQRSPIRILMKSIQGGLKPGELGVIASPSGIGKTSVLVQIALDKLLQGKKVIHVSFTQHADHVLAWYEDIFDEIIRKKNLENKLDIKNDIVKNRVLMKFNQEGLTVDQIIRSLRAMISDGGFSAEYIIIDGYNFSSNDKENVSKIREFAQDLKLSVWFSCTVTGAESSYDDKKIPVAIKDYADLFDVIVDLEPMQDHIALALSRNRDEPKPDYPALRLDPKTLLILEENV
jgi:KaiC/GvpD/RAD55 family RecA-like ATPase